MVIPLTQGKFAQADNDDFLLLAPYKWYANKSSFNWYAVRKVRVNGKRLKLYMHRVILDCPDNQQVHHIDGDSLNNRRKNLVACSQSENLSFRRYGEGV